MMGVIVGSATVKVLVEAKSPPEGLRELDRSETITKLGFGFNIYLATSLARYILKP